MDDTKIMPPRREEMKVRVWECGVRGWVKGGQRQYNASQEGGMKVRVWECGSVGMGEGWMTPR